MKMITRLLCASTALAAITVGAIQPGAAAPKEYKVDPEHFTIGFLVEHIGYARTLGMFLEGAGSFTYDRDSRALSNVRIVINTESVFTNHKRRDAHLRSPDFLNSDEFPEMVFTAAGVDLTGDNTGKIAGSLELLGQARPLTLDVTLNKAAVYPFGHEEMTLGISARASFKRSDYGMTYAVDNGFVGDTVDLILELEAIEQ